nr:VanZ family protein [Kitasatospora sp. SID7827]
MRPAAAAWTAPPNLDPLSSVREAFALDARAAVHRLASGMLPLAPLGVLLPLAVGSPARAWLPSFLRATGAAALLGTALEILEGVAPGHVLDVDDVLLGTAGAALAHLLLVPPLRALERRRAAAAAGPAAGPAVTPDQVTPDPVTPFEDADDRGRTRPRPVPSAALSVLGSTAAPRG